MMMIEYLNYWPLFLQYHGVATLKKKKTIIETRCQRGERAFNIFLMEMFYLANHITLISVLKCNFEHASIFKNLQSDGCWKLFRIRFMECDCPFKMFKMI